MWLALVLSVGLRSLSSVAGLKGRTTTLTGSGRRCKVCRFKNWDWDKMAPWGCSRCDRAIVAAEHQFGCGFLSVHGGSSLELAYLHKRKKIRQRRLCAFVLIGSIRMKP